MKVPLLATIAGWAMLVHGSLLAREVGLARIDGPIGPATAEYVARAVTLSVDDGMEALVIELNTPGGLLESTQSIVQSFYSSRVPIVVYVAPSGASATSAGCFITLAADIASMAPNTSIGAAHPVAIGGGGQQAMDETMNQKLENFASSAIEAIAEKRGRNVEWAISAVRESASITSESALELGVIEFIAGDLSELLTKINGHEVNGRRLETEAAAVQELPMLLRERVFQMIWRPEVMFILMLIAVYGILGELSNPGGILPGVIGVVALVLALYMTSVLPVNIAGFALIALAIGLFVAEAFTPTFGLFTGAGTIAFLIGAIMLFDDAAPAFRLSLTMILPATVVTTLFFVFVVGAGLRAQRLPVRAGAETMHGQPATALTEITAASGRVLVEGEDWEAFSEKTVHPGETVQVIENRGLTLKVKPLERKDPS